MDELSEASAALAFTLAQTQFSHCFSWAFNSTALPGVLDPFHMDPLCTYLFDTGTHIIAFLLVVHFATRRVRPGLWVRSSQGGCMHNNIVLYRTHRHYEPYRSFLSARWHQRTGPAVAKYSSCAKRHLIGAEILYFVNAILKEPNIIAPKGASKRITSWYTEKTFVRTDGTLSVRLCLDLVLAFPPRETYSIIINPTPLLEIRSPSSALLLLLRNQLPCG